MKMVALIPARAGSKRCPGKNTRLLAGKPLINYTIEAAIESGVFGHICVCSDDPRVMDATLRFGARGPSYVDRASVSDDQADIVWVKDALMTVEAATQDLWPAFAILRPTSPFRTAETIERAYKQFSRQEVHSIRAVRPVTEHPGKMWMLDNGCLVPVIPEAVHPDGTPWHSSPTQSLPPVYVQTASLEMAWTWVVKSFGTISGKKIAPFYTDPWESFDINTEEDFEDAEAFAQMLTT